MQARDARIVRCDPSTEYWFDEGCHILELWNSAQDGAASVARARRHRLKAISERYVVLEGRGRVEVGDLAPAEIGAGDVVVIPPGVAQRVANVGDADLVFLAICTPRFVREAYEDIE